MSFDDIRLPDTVEKGSNGGPRFKTTITTLANGFEQRNIDWSRVRHEYDISYGIGTKAVFREVLEFFFARVGRAYGFRFKDWSNFEATMEAIGVGNGTQTKFQLVKAMGDAARAYSRIIQKPVAGTASFFVNGIEEPGATLDTTNGVVTFDVAPANGAVIAWSGEFDVPVRFNTDKLDINLQYFDAGSVPRIPIVEILQPLGSLV